MRSSSVLGIGHSVLDSELGDPSPAEARADADPAPSVCGVVVTYRPDPIELDRTLAAVAPQVAALVVVDNATPETDLVTFAEAAGTAGAVLLRQADNLGLAAAQNAGIAWAREHGHTHVLLLDQDSVPGAGMVDALIGALRELSGAQRVAGVGPRFRDHREDRDAPFVRVAFPMSHKIRCGANGKPVPVDFLISSGTLIPMAVLDDVGGVDDELFIDNVDLDWCFRVRARGYRLFGVCAATMEHRLGDHRQAVLGGCATVVTHGPVRLYYIMRNRITLYRRPHTPRVWIAQDVPRVLVKFVIFGVLVGPRARNIHYMLRGLLDGMRGRLGPCPLVTV